MILDCMLGLLLILGHSMVNTRMLAHRDAEKEREESISSLQPTPESVPAPSAVPFGAGAAELGRYVPVMSSAFANTDDA